MSADVTQMRRLYAEAFKLISEGLELDGGQKSHAADLYAQGLTKLDEALKLGADEKGESVAMLREKMRRNQTMVEERLKKLVQEGFRDPNRHAALAHDHTDGTFNIFPLTDAAQQGVILVAELRAAAADLAGIFDTLSRRFGFQAASVRNQHEHLSMLLANATIRHRGAAHRHIHEKVFANYRQWCRHLSLEPCLRPSTAAAAQTLEDVSLFLLIWGEAANLRHMAERCLPVSVSEHADGERRGLGPIRG